MKVVCGSTREHLAVISADVGISAAETDNAADDGRIDLIAAAAAAAASYCGHRRVNIVDDGF